MTIEQDVSPVQHGRRRRRVTLQMLGLVVAVLTLLGLGASPALASAYGAAGFGPTVPVLKVTVPMGTYHAYISGSGTYVSYVKGWPQLNSQVGNVCNWNITVEFFDRNGRWYRTLTGPFHQGCNSYWNQANADFLYLNGHVQVGRMCSTLKSNGGRLTSVCHNIG